jgi:hypothetical protein
MTSALTPKGHRGNLVIEVRDLVRMDMALNGVRFIIVEFALATAVAVVIGSFVLFAGTPKGSLSVTLAGCFFFLWELNALTFLLLALSIIRRGDHGHRADYDRRVTRIYGLWAIGLILVSLVFPLLALGQRVRLR